MGLSIRVSTQWRVSGYTDHVGLNPRGNRIVVWFDDDSNVTISGLHIAPIEKGTYWDRRSPLNPGRKDRPARRRRSQIRALSRAAGR
jgi:hypothetical protein